MEKQRKKEERVKWSAFWKKRKERLVVTVVLSNMYIMVFEKLVKLSRPRVVRGIVLINKTRVSVAYRRPRLASSEVRRVPASSRPRVALLISYSRQRSRSTAGALSFSFPRALAALVLCLSFGPACTLPHSTLLEQIVEPIDVIT